MVQRVERARKQKMTRGVILFAFNSPKYNYYEMAKYTAKRIEHFLNLPVTLVTDDDSMPAGEYQFWDKVVKITPDKDNFRDWGQWINKGRYMAYDLSPYDETLLLDVDYVVNSDKLLKIFDFYDDFCCHNRTEYLMLPGAPQELLSAYSYETLWATVVAFKKTDRAKQIFDSLRMVQENYDHYANIHSFVGGVFRNDYALTLALKIVNGHSDDKNDYIPWNLIHLGKNTQISKNNEDELDTSFKILFDNWQRGKIRKEYINITNMDFHIMNKDLFVEIING
jgi:hypothetical protein